jgi:polysaccharide pyruvyl transferase WcaK-like protein
MTPPRIALYGLFGRQNLGNECTLQALLLNLRLRFPETEMLCVCFDPADVATRHGIPGVQMDTGQPHPEAGPSGPKRLAKRKSVLSRLVRRVLGELACMARAWRVLRGSRLFIVAGTGILEDTGWSAAWYFGILKWCVIARIRACKVVFLSVGMGPIRSPLSRLVTRLALRCASYVSYRDTASRDFSRSIGVDTSDHHVFPDLAFSLPEPAAAAGKACGANRPRIGVGVMDYYGPQDSGQRVDVYEAYVHNTCELLLALSERGCSTRILYGDARHDPPVVTDVRRCLEQRGHRNATLTTKWTPISSVADVIEAISEVDLVIAPRFHNLVLGLVLGKPVISLSYHWKNDELLREFGLRDYCHPIDGFAVSRLLTQVEALTGSEGTPSVEIRRRVDLQSRLLKQQYDLLLQLVAHQFPDIQPGELSTLRMERRS